MQKDTVHHVEKHITPRLAALMASLEAKKDDGGRAFELSRALNAAQEFSRAQAVAADALSVLQKRRKKKSAARSSDDGVAGSLWFERLYAIARRDVRDLPEYERQVQRLVRESPKASWAHRNLALVYYYTEEDAKCRKALAKAIELDPRDAGAHEVRALMAQADGDPDELRAILEAGLKAAPRDARLRKLWGDASLEVGDTELARTHYVKAVEEEPLYVEAWHALGDLSLSHDGDYVAGLRCFSHALAINPRYWDVYFTLTDYYVDEKRYDLAKAEVLKVLLLDPDSSIKAEVENHLGYMDYLQGVYEDAVKRYRRAITLDPDFDSPWHNLGLVHVHEKDYDSAIECFEKAIALNEDRSWSYTQLGLAYLEKKNVRKAKSLFESALRRSPDEYGAYLGLAELHRRDKRYEEQLDACLKALQIEPNDGNVRNSLGIAYECTKRHDEAIQQYQEALRLDPHNRWAANNLGYLYERLHATTDDDAYREKAVAAWRVRLLICRDMQASTAGARRHILKLGVPEATFERWLRDGKLDTELQRIL